MDHPLLPPRHLTWAESLATGAPVGKKALSNALTAGYRFPEPALLVTAQSPETWQRYLANWLVLRPLWLGIVAERDHMPSPAPKEWRAFLNSRPQDFQEASATTRTAETRKAALNFFGDLLPNIGQGTSWAQTGTVSFRGTTVDLTTDIPPIFVQSVLWELAEVSFRADLLTLDKHLMANRMDTGPAALFPRAELYDTIFPSPTVGGTWDAPVPTENAGLLHNNFRHPSFLSAINAFRAYIAAWPGAESEKFLHERLEESMSEGNLRVRVVKIFRFYISTFFIHTGRPPVIPRCVPVIAGQ